eukprot:3430605-Rhodomonas_salina.1
MHPAVALILEEVASYADATRCPVLTGRMLLPGDAVRGYEVEEVFWERYSVVRALEMVSGADM